MGQPATITLSETEESELLRRIKLRKSAQDARLRAEIILACAGNQWGDRSTQTQHRSTKFLAFLREIDVSVPADMPIHLIMDNYATHKTDKVRAWLAARPRYNIHVWTRPVLSTRFAFEHCYPVASMYKACSRKRLASGQHRIS